MRFYDPDTDDKLPILLPLGLVGHNRRIVSSRSVGDSQGWILAGGLQNVMNVELEDEQPQKKADGHG